MNLKLKIQKKRQVWKNGSIFETGILHCPKPLEAPDEFMIDETNVDFLEAHMEEMHRAGMRTISLAGILSKRRLREGRESF